MSLKPPVSVIVTVYNRQRYLAQTIESVLAQSYSDFELLIWDDGSTDKSLAIAQKYAAIDRRIRVVAYKHLGLGWTPKKAIAATSGRYFWCVDSDDILHKDALLETLSVLERSPDVGMVYTQYQVMDEVGNIGVKGKRCQIPYSPQRLLMDFMTFHFRLIRRSIYESIGGIKPEFTTAPDYDLCLRLSEVTEIEHIPKPLYLYRQHSLSISSQREFEQVKYSKQAIEDALVRRGLTTEIALKLKLKPKFRLQPQLDPTQTTVLNTLPALKTKIKSDRLVSIVVTVHNRAEYLPATIDSILAQTHADFELIIWDDGSTDRGLAIALEYEKLDKRVRVFSDPNQGQGTALVRAIAKTNCKYLCTADSDDLLHPEALAKTVAVLEASSNLGMVYTDHILINAEGKERGLGKRCSIPYSPERLLIDFMTFHLRLYRRTVYDAVGGFDASLRSAEDYDLCLRLSEITQIEHLAEPLYYYRWHEQNLSTTQQLTQTKCSAIAIERAIYRRSLSSKLRLEVKLNPKYQLRRKTEVATKKH